MLVLILSRKIQLPPLNKESTINRLTPLNIYLMCGEEERIVAEYGEKVIPAFS